MFVDDAMNPSLAQLITNASEDFGGFCRFAGDANTQAAQEAVTKLPTRTYIMPSSKEWSDLLFEIHKDRVKEQERFSFSAASLEIAHLERLSLTPAASVEIHQIDSAFAQRLFDDPQTHFHFADWSSPSEFVKRGIGFCAVAGTKILCAATSSLVCKSGIEVNVMTHPEYRRRGVATSVCSRLAIECLRHGLSPHWDAANPASAQLAKKLGYTPTGTYCGYILEL